MISNSRNLWIVRVYLLLCIFLYSSFAKADIKQDDDLNIEKLATGLSVPWGMAVLPDNMLLIGQREGKLFQLNLDSHVLKPIVGLPKDIKVVGQGGLFDIKLAPDFIKTGWIYFSYSKDNGKYGQTTLARAKLVKAHLTEWQDIFVSRATETKDRHYGGRITFDRQGHVFLSVGERGHRPNAQDLSNDAGKVLRLNLDGSIPIDNPFVGKKAVSPEIWSYGHRNPQGLYFDTETHSLWEIEHGPRGGDEINLVEAGRNYGWPVISYGKEYWAPLSVGEGTHQQGMEQPIRFYIPSIAPSSLIRYQGNLFKGWKGNLLAGALALQHLNRIVLDGNNQVIKEQRLLTSLNARIRNVIEGPSGELYIGTDSGDIYRITPRSQ